MTEKKEYTYQIGDKKYIQRKLVLGQIRQLTSLLDGTVISGDKSDVAHWIRILDDKIHLALAVVLTEEGASLMDKDIYKSAKKIEFSIEPEQVTEVIEDFFVCNPIASLLQRLEGTISRISKVIIRGNGTGSESSASSLAEETSSKETESSGSTP